MIQYITDNWTTLLAAAIVIIALALAFAVLSNKNNGEKTGGCSGNCSSCGSSCKPEEIEKEEE